MERLRKREGLEAVAVGGDAVGEAAVAAEDQAAEFTGGPAAGIVGGAEAEVEARADGGRGVGAAVVAAVPAGVAVEVLRLTKDSEIVQPDLAAVVGALLHVQKPEAAEGGAVRAVTRVEVADR